MSEKTSENPKETVVESEETPVENSKELNQLAMIFLRKLST